ncbi:MAG: phospho-N-acetylmuramoyl-pentapeptide-transferase [Ruminococcaceae bacterium]|nr:phospho-N-acetylmuramoyl-pentapeptide-transferase [Oscillospiraceae bacterium]
MKTDILNVILPAALIFLATVLLSRKIIPILRSHKVGQKILDIGPRWHKSKEGTPTMGGICFILSILLVMTGIFVYFGVEGRAKELIPLALTLGLATANGMIGFIDDYTKLVKKQNEGLLAYQKFLFQVVAAVIYILVLHKTGYLSTVLYIPYFGVEWDMGILYYLFALILITGIVNSVNLTDGIDGLASLNSFCVGLFLCAVSLVSKNLSLGLISSCLIGATLGFLVYNFYPARVFMGDTGSLFLGGMIVGSAFVMNNPLLVLVFGLVFVLETFSVMLQVGYFKLTHKRIFKMAPVHHHFEQCGWSEIKIVCVFSLFTLIFCVIAWFGVRF